MPFCEDRYWNSETLTSSITLSVPKETNSEKPKTLSTFKKIRKFLQQTFSRDNNPDRFIDGMLPKKEPIETITLQINTLAPSSLSSYTWKHIYISCHLAGLLVRKDLPRRVLLFGIYHTGKTTILKQIQHLTNPLENRFSVTQTSVLDFCYRATENALDKAPMSEEERQHFLDQFGNQTDDPLNYFQSVWSNSVLRSFIENDNDFVHCAKYKK